MHANLNTIRKIYFHGLEIGGESSFPILNPAFVLNISVCYTEDNFDISGNYYKTDDFTEIIKKANSSACDIIGLTFNIKGTAEIEKAVSILKKCLLTVQKPVMISGTGKDDIDKELLPELIKHTDREVIVNSINENIYKSVVPSVIKGGHIAVLKTPIDINLTKELNILSSDLGLSLDKILVDTDIGGLGYGLEYGYSIMEKTKLEGLKGDNYLNMPIISFACTESLKTKEAKTDSETAKFFELTAASAVMACGANVIVMNYPPNISVMKGLVK